MMDISTSNNHPPEWFTAKLAASGISLDHAATLGFRVVKPPEANQLLGFGNANWPDAFAIPFFDPQTGAPMKTPDGRDFVRLRFEHPVEMRDGSAKYLSPAKGGQHAYVLSEVHRHQLEAPTDPVLLTEGELKAICATKHGIHMIGLPGIDGFSGGDKRLLPELARYATPGRVWIMIYDSDAADPKKAAAFDASSDRFSAALAEYGCILRRVILPSVEVAL